MPSNLYIDSSGSVVPVDDPQAAALQGWVPASPKQIEDFEIQQKFGTPTEAAKAFAEHTASALTFGASDVAEREAGVDPAAMAGREKANPIASGAGTALGIVAPVAATLGAAALPEAAGQTAIQGAKLAAPSLIARAGEALAPKAVTTLGRIGSKAVQYGAEGALYGVQQVVHEAALGDPNLTAQSAIATVGLSAALGGWFGGAIQGGSEAIPALVGKAKAAIGNAFSRGAQKTIESIGDSTGVPPDVTSLLIEHRQELHGFEQAAPGVTEQISAADPLTAKFLLENQSRVMEAERSFPGFTKNLAQASPDTAAFILDNWQAVRRDPSALNTLKDSQRNALQDVYSHVESAAKLANTEIRPAENALFLNGPHLSVAGDGLEWVDRDQALTMAGKIARSVQKSAEAMRAEPELYSSGYAGSLEKIVDGLRRDLTPESTPADLFNRLKTLRKQVDELIPYGKDTLGMGLSERNAANELKGLRSTIKGALTDEHVWGSAGVREEAYNDATSQYILAKKEFQKKFMTKSQTRTGGISYEVDPVKVNGWFNSMADPRGQLRTRAVDQYIEASKALLDEIEKSHSATNVVGFDRSAVESVINKSGEITADARRGQTATELYKHLQGVQILGSGPVTPGVELAQRAAGMILPGYVTSTINASLNVAKTAASVPKAVGVLAALERISQSVSRKIDSAAKALTESTSLSRASGVARQEASAGVAKIFSQGPREALKNHEMHAEEVLGAAGNPEKFQAVLTDQAAGMQEHAPQTAQALNVASARALAFLASKLPPTPKPGPLSAPLQPSPSQIATYNRYRDAVENPTGILRQAAAGTLTPEAVEAVRTVYPQLMDKIVAAAMLSAAGKELPYRARLMLYMLAGHDVDGSMTPQAIMANQAIWMRASMKPQGQPQGRAPRSNAGKMTTGDRYLTDFQRSGRGER